MGEKEAFIDRELYKVMLVCFLNWAGYPIGNGALLRNVCMFQ